MSGKGIIKAQPDLVMKLSDIFGGLELQLKGKSPLTPLFQRGVKAKGMKRLNSDLLLLSSKRPSSTCLT
ncbi:hypothetical protein EV682_11033 [Iodobacter fluviatilis]|uniref:Uncharacterized protein n=1 Tax=Iodobacter fluviatilis TaxID=537 RepID=A0A377Q530_9NEIS|nr:hypothetical protein EV682_11033 [Iodobacter fluviatilis]STQ89709.1 Uncharacterised protein [Iodobacter fluviatilis]